VPVLLVLGTMRDQELVSGMVRRALIVAALVTLLLAALPGYFLARRSLAPVGVMTRRAARIGAENLSERLPVANAADELGQLAVVFNDLLDRLQSAFQRQRQFMASAAHELRTPVAVVRGEAELALSREERSPAEYREALDSMKVEAVRMSRIVDDLLTLSRAVSGQLHMQRSKLDLREIIEDAVRALRVGMPERSVAVDLDLREEMPFEGDGQLLQRVFSNLILNAIRHTDAGTRVEVSGRRAGASYDIRVRDHGQGVAPADTEGIFEPFFRGEQARGAGEDNGAGLGLPIARSSAQVHGGEVVMLSTGSEGSVFQVTLPAPAQD
jgi:heavy metal sensor kinase